MLEATEGRKHCDERLLKDARHNAVTRRVDGPRTNDKIGTSFDRHTLPGLVRFLANIHRGSFFLEAPPISATIHAFDLTRQ